MIRCTRNQVLGQVTHTNTILALGALTLEFPWDLALGLGSKPPFVSHTLGVQGCNGGFIVVVQGFLLSLSHHVYGL